MNRSIGILLSLMIIAIGSGVYLYNKPHKKMANMNADYKMEANELFLAFQSDEAEANTRYLDKVIEISGTVAEVKRDEDGHLSVFFESGGELSGVICQMDELVPQNGKQMNVGQKITLKGICTGMLMDVVLVRCIRIA